MTGEGTTVVAGIVIPSTSPLFLAIVGLHVLLGLACVLSGAVAMLSPKRSGRHPRFGSIYYWCLAALFVSSGVLAARRRRRPGWARPHITGMGLSYVVLLTAFYVDNGKSLPLWRDLPPIAYWLLPAAVGVPLIVLTLLRHPLAR